MSRSRLKVLALIVALFLSILVVNNQFTNHYVGKLTSKSSIVTAKTNALYEEIKSKAPSYEIAPKDAYVDSVWKAIPGYNGLKVDINASYAKMKKLKKFDKNKLVLKEVSPKIHLSDLPPSPVYKGNPDKPLVAFTINVAWGNEYIPKMLEVLKKHNAKATFFLEGRWVKNNPTLAQLITAANQEVGNHSYTHPDMARLGSQEIKNEIVETNSVILATTDQKVVWFAPPSGSYRDEVVKIASNLGLSTIMWTADTIDWQKPPKEVIIYRVMKKVENGTIVLMHPTKPTADALDELLTKIEASGRKVVNISTLLDEKRYDTIKKVENK
ncbi:polysaccharide deacetylase family protein [Gottfriedia luciferensis]|uniref:polysaccharide deacetylase family protein n=1 Tax=Gottfriedia luciferensis TaxID=178774 RepID=UPI000B443428|nr:polysaccharide deacetylase family protein [Gottfriedia luciferensis]